MGSSLHPSMKAAHLKKEVQNHAVCGKSVVNGILGHTRYFSFRVPGPWGNSECISLLYYTATPEGSHVDETNRPAHRGSNPSQSHDKAYPLTVCITMQLLEQF
jgi:hypothetical protein